MKFLFQHDLFDRDKSGVLKGGKEYTETTLPSHWYHKDFKWFLDAHILTLKVGESVDSEWHHITRLK